jgi:hypothetical protein
VDSWVWTPYFEKGFHAFELTKEDEHEVLVIVRKGGLDPVKMHELGMEEALQPQEAQISVRDVCPTQMWAMEGSPRAA